MKTPLTEMEQLEKEINDAHWFIKWVMAPVIFMLMTWLATL